MCGNSTGLLTLDGAGCEDDIKFCKNIALDCAGCEDDIMLSENRTDSVALYGAGCEDDISVCENSTGSVTMVELETSSRLPGTDSYGEELVTSRLEMCTRKEEKLPACVSPPPHFERLSGLLYAESDLSKLLFSSSKKVLQSLVLMAASNYNITHFMTYLIFYQNTRTNNIV